MLPRIIGRYRDGRPIFAIEGGADDPDVDNGGLSDITVATDEVTGNAHAQLMKIAYSADGDRTHAQVDADGQLVNLGSNNDVTITSGSVGVSSVPADPFGADADAASASGSISAKLRQIATTGVPVTSLPALAAGTAYAGKVRLTDGTTDVSVLTGTNPSIPVAIVDSSGDQLSLSTSLTTTATPTLDTSAYASGDSLDSTILSFTNAVAASAGSGHILRMTVIDDDDQGIDLTVHFFESSVTPATENTAHSLSDGDADEYIGSISTSAGTWQDHQNNQTVTVTPAPPLPFKLDSGTTLYGIAVTEGAPTYTASGLEIKLQIMPD